MFIPKEENRKYVHVFGTAKRIPYYIITNNKLNYIALYYITQYYPKLYYTVTLTIIKITILCCYYKII